MISTLAAATLLSALLLMVLNASKPKPKPIPIRTRDNRVVRRPQD